MTTTINGSAPTDAQAASVAGALKLARSFGEFASLAALQTAYPAAANNGAHATVGGLLHRVTNGVWSPVSGDGLSRAAIALDGDSLFGMGQGQYSSWTGTQTGGVATVTLPSTHLLVAGQLIRLAGAADARWNGVFRLSTAAGTQVTFAIDAGASATATADPAEWGMVAYSPSVVNERDPINAALAINNLAANVINFSTGGRTTQKCATQLLASDPLRYSSAKIIILETCSNDAPNGVTVAQSVQAQRDRVAWARGAGLVPVLTTPAPYSSAYTSANAKAAANTAQAIRDLAAELGVDLWDVHAAMVDPASANGYAVSGAMAADGIHPTGTGWILAAPSLATILDRYIPSRNRSRIVSRADADTASGRQVCPNALMTGTGGATAASLSGGVAGANAVVPTGWAGTRSATFHTWNIAKASGAFGADSAATISVRGGAAFDDAYLHSADLTSALTAGRLVRLGCRLDADIRDDLVITVSLTLTYTGGAGDVFALKQASATTGEAFPRGVRTYHLESPDDWVVPAGLTITSARLRIRVLSLAAGTDVSTVTVTAPWIYAR